jgi:hypothetical protein
MSYYSNGTLTTGKRSIGVSDTWETQEDWEAYQSINQIEISNGTVLLGSFTFPENEDFSHNDLSGTYVGDTGQYTISFSDPTYRLKTSSPSGDCVVVRDSADWERYGVRMDWETYFGNSFSEGGVVFAATKAGWGSSLDGYLCYSSQANDDNYIQRVDGGSTTGLATTSGPGSTGGSWVSCYVKLLSDGTIEYSYGNTTIASASDQTFDRVNLGFYSNDEDPPVYWRNVTFSVI